VVCPHCGHPEHKKVGFTWWGGALGPRMFNHVECLKCRGTYNSNTGQPNTTGIAIYVVVSTLIVFAIYMSIYG